MADQELFDRQTALIRRNVEWLQQAFQLAGDLDEETFTKAPPGMPGHRVSAHLRHIVEFYECFLAGLDFAHVDYDARRRDPALETSRRAALERIHLLMERLELDPALRGDGALFVRMEDASGLSLAQPFLMSSVGRELQMLSSHAVHHFALIAITLQAHGVPVAPDFGVAPSTLRHRAEQVAEMLETAA